MTTLPVTRKLRHYRWGRSVAFRKLLPLCFPCSRFWPGKPGLRRMEALALRWEWIDARSRCIRLPDTKSGAQLRPIGAAAVSFLESLPRESGACFVFRADVPGRFRYSGAPALVRQ